MKYKLVKMVQNDNILEIHLKRPMFDTYEGFYYNFDDFGFSRESYIGQRLSENGKCIILSFVLRSKKDIEPYENIYKLKEEELLKKYDYAILVNGSSTKLIYDGREEKKLKRIQFDTNGYGYIPTLEIEK